MVAVHTPEQFWPIFGTLTFDQSVAEGVADLHPHVVASGTGSDEQGEPNRFVIFGSSQSARIATIEKRNLIEDYDPETSPRGAVVMMGNPNRGNGGLLERFNGLFIPILGVTFDGATPTNGPVDPGDPDDPTDDTFVYPTEDYATVRRLGRLPGRAVNFLATANAIAGIALLHSDYLSSSVSDPLYQGTLGDTNYYVIPTKHLPLLMVGPDRIPSPIVTALDAPMRVLVERAYRRDINPGTPTPARLISFTNPIEDLVNFVVAIPTGIDDAIAEAANDPTSRPLGTAAVTSPFGVGGPDLPDPPPGVTPSLAAAPGPQPKREKKKKKKFFYKPGRRPKRGRRWPNRLPRPSRSMRRRRTRRPTMTPSRTRPPTPRGRPSQRPTRRSAVGPVRDQAAAASADSPWPD